MSASLGTPRTSRADQVLRAVAVVLVGATSACALGDRSEERDCRAGIAQLEGAIAAWQGGINAKTEAENQLDFADGAADFGLWSRCRSSLQRGFRALGRAP